jgi:hypothetical protein
MSTSATPTPRARRNASASGVPKEAWRTSITTVSPENHSQRRARRLREAGESRKEAGNWRRRAPSLPAPRRGARASRKARTSAGPAAASSSWVKERWALAVKTNSRRCAVRRSHSSAVRAAGTR